MKKFLLLILLPLFLTSALGQQTTTNLQTNNEPTFHPGRVIVRFAGTPQFINGSGQARGLSQRLNIFTVNNPPGMSVAQAIARYRNNPNVIYAEPDYEVHAVDTTPTDPMWSDQWDMTKIQAPAAWDTQQTANDIVVAIVDTGIDYTHPDLQGNIWSDGTGNGFTCMNGSCTYGGVDDYGHGTHVAGTIGAVSDNGIGIAGINSGVQLLSMKFLNSSGSGYISDAVVAFNKIAQLKDSGINIRVTNNSWGGGGYTQALKDAMAAVESRGILDVCAAGNSGLNVDASPMYPGAYDNRGILSVAASDSSDHSPSWTNYGLANVDIAAPGVSTLSTVPTGSCSLCDSSGYRLLSGTSMATPHVAGVAAALFHAYPGANAYQMRDVLLDPASYDTVTDSRLQSTSTGGRLNFYKALMNSKWGSLPSLTLNNFPTISAPSAITATSGQLINLSASASDPDPNDTLSLGWMPLASGYAIYGLVLRNIFPTPPLNTNPYSFPAPSISRLAFTNYAVSAADRRGGGATASSAVEILPDPNFNQPPTGVLTLSTHNVNTNGSVNLNFVLTDPENESPLYWQAWFLSANVWGEMCCISNPSQNFALTLSYPGVYRISAQGIDSHLNVSAKYSDVVRVGGANGTPPIALASVDRLDGQAPLTVHIDMSASSDPDGSISTYGFYCPDGLKTSANPQNTCTFSEPGNYYLWTTVKDNDGLMDADKTYITVLPASSTPPPDDTTPPTVTITEPANGSTVSTTTTIEATASDNMSGVASVTIVAGGTDLCTVTTSPYSCSWDTTSVTDGDYDISASATDGAGNTGNATPVTVTVDNAAPPDTTPPTVTITAPTDGSTISGTTDLKATASDNTSVTSVVFSDGTNTLCTDTSAPYTCSWNTTAAVGDGDHTISATATDAAGNSTTTSATVTVDNTSPDVSIASPNDGDKVQGSIAVTAMASDTTSGVASVTITVDGTTLCSNTTSPTSCDWDTTTVPNGDHSISASATDTAGNPGDATPITINVNNDINMDPPTVSFVPPTPEDGSSLPRGRYTIQVEASANATGASLASIELSMDGQTVDSSSTSPLTYMWNTNPKKEKGTHMLKATATDTLNKSSSMTITLTAE